MDECRKNLAIHCGRRITVRGVWRSYRSDYNGCRACIENPEIHEVVACDHVWVLNCGSWAGETENLDGEVRFDAVVQKYTDIKTGETNYCLASPGQPNVINPPAIRIPQPVVQNDEQPEQRKAVTVNDDPTPSPDVVADIRATKAWIRVVGSSSKALEILDAQPALPITQLREYIVLLGEE